MKTNFTILLTVESLFSKYFQALSSVLPFIQRRQFHVGCLVVMLLLQGSLIANNGFDKTITPPSRASLISIVETPVNQNKTLVDNGHIVSANPFDKVWLNLNEFVLATVCDSFEDETANATTFSQGGTSFSTSGDLFVEYFLNLGSGPSDFWVGTGYGNGGSAPGSVGSIRSWPR